MYAFKALCTKNGKNYKKRNGRKNDLQEDTYLSSVCKKHVRTVRCCAEASKTSSLCGLLASTSVSSVESLEAETTKSSPRYFNEFKNCNYSRVETFDQTLVEYLTEKLKRSPHERKTVDRFWKSGAKALSPPLPLNFKKNKVDRSPLRARKARLNNKRSPKTQSPINTPTEYSFDGRKKKAAKSRKGLQVKRIKPKVSSTQRPRVHVVHTSPHSQAERSNGSTSYRLGHLFDSVSTMEYELPTYFGGDRGSIGLDLPEKYVIGRHFFQLVRNIKSNKSPIDARVSPVIYRPTRLRSRKPDTIYSVCNKTPNYRFSWPKKSTYVYKRPYGGLYKKKSKYSVDDVSAQPSIATKPKANRRKSRNSLKHLDYGTRKSDISLPGRREIDKCSLSSGITSLKPLRTVLKKTEHKRCRQTGQRSVRFDCYPRIHKGFPTECKSHKIKPEKREEHEESLPRHCVIKRASSAQKPSQQSSKLTSSRPPSPPRVSRRISFENWKPVTPYIRLKSDEDSARNETANKPCRKPSPGTCKSTTICKPDASDLKYRHRSVPNRSSYARLRNKGEQEIGLMNFTSKRQAR